MDGATEYMPGPATVPLLRPVIHMLRGSPHRRKGRQMKKHTPETEQLPSFRGDVYEKLLKLN